jgi:hypothetical protein
VVLHVDADRVFVFDDAGAPVAVEPKV